MSHISEDTAQSRAIKESYAEYPDMTSADGQITDGVYRLLIHDAHYEYDMLSEKLTIDLTGASDEFAGFVRENITNRRVSLLGTNSFALPEQFTLKNGWNPHSVRVFSDNVSRLDLEDGGAEGTRSNTEKGVTTDYMAPIGDIIEGKVPTCRIITTKSGEVQRETCKEATQMPGGWEYAPCLIRLKAPGLHSEDFTGVLQSAQQSQQSIIPIDGPSRGIWAICEREKEEGGEHLGDGQAKKFGDFIFFVPYQTDKAGTDTAVAPTEGDA